MSYKKIIDDLRQETNNGNNTSGNMGFSIPFNQAAEFNIGNDPHGAQWAFANMTANNVPITMVPLDATDDVPFQQYLLDTLKNSPQTPEAQLVGGLMYNLRATWFAPELFFVTAYLWDPTAAIVMLYPEVVVSTRDVNLRVVINQGVNGAEQGATRICTDQEARVPGACARVRVVYDVYGQAVTNTLLNLFQSPVNSARRSLSCPV